MGSKASRNTSIEALRLVAVAGIAIFHTFQWTFQAVCTGLPEYAPLAVFPYSGALGFINLLGCWANEVFFMISVVLPYPFGSSRPPKRVIRTGPRS